MSAEPWVFGVSPLSQNLELAPLLRRIAGLALSLEGSDSAVARLIDDLRNAERDLAARAPTDVAPRLGADAPASQRVYLDHGRHVGAYNPCFPEYVIEVDGAEATGTVTFPLVFEGPPAIVHGGVIANFFDCVIQHHNCDVGVAGKTTRMEITYRRPAPLGVGLRFEIDRVADQRRITSNARLLQDDDVVAAAVMEAVAGERSNLPFVSPRGGPS